MPTLGEIAKQEFIKDVLAMGIFGVVAAAIFLGIQGFYSDSEHKQMEREAAFNLEIRFMTDGGNRIKDNFAYFVAGVSEVITQGVPPDRETRKDILTASSIIRTEVAILSEYDMKLKVRGDIMMMRMDELSDNINTYSRGELLDYKQQLAQVKEDYQAYILKLNAVAKAHLLVRPSPYR